MRLRARRVAMRRISWIDQRMRSGGFWRLPGSFHAAVLFGRHSRNPSGPAAMMPRQQGRTHDRNRTASWLSLLNPASRPHMRAMVVPDIQTVRDVFGEPPETLPDPLADRLERLRRQSRLLSSEPRSGASTDPGERHHESVERLTGALPDRLTHHVHILE
jgi:hypothetical protein